MQRIVGNVGYVGRSCKTRCRKWKRAVVHTASWGGVGTEVAAAERADDAIGLAGLTGLGDEVEGFRM